MKCTFWRQYNVSRSSIFCEMLDCGICVGREDFSAGNVYYFHFLFCRSKNAVRWHANYAFSGSKRRRRVFCLQKSPWQEMILIWMLLRYVKYDCVFWMVHVCYLLTCFFLIARWNLENLRQSSLKWMQIMTNYSALIMSSLNTSLSSTR